MSKFICIFTILSIAISFSNAHSAASEAVKDTLSESAHMEKLLKDVFAADLARGDVGAQALAENANNKYIKDNHVFSALSGEYHMTLVPLTDYLFSEGRLDSFNVAIEFGKLTIKEWIMMVGRHKQAFESPEHEKSVAEGLELLQNKSDFEISAKIQELRNEGIDLARPNEKDFFALANGYKDKKKRADEFQKELEELKSIIRADNAEHSKIFMPEGLDVNTIESVFPDAFIVQVGWKFPSLPPSTNEPLPNGASKADRALKAMADASKFVGRFFASNASITVTLMARPWYKHVRHIPTNPEVTRNTIGNQLSRAWESVFADEVVPQSTASTLSNPFSWHWELAGQLWYSKDARKKQDVQFTNPRMRVGAGLLWSRDMKSITEVGGIFLGASHTRTSTANLAKAQNPETLAGAQSTSIKYGTIFPAGALTLNDPGEVFEHKYVLLGRNFGVPVERQKSLHGNGGYVFSLAEFINISALPLGEETEEQKAANEYVKEQIEKIVEEKEKERAAEEAEKEKSTKKK